jgi:hypothetical protein
MRRAAMPTQLETPNTTTGASDMIQPATQTEPTAKWWGQSITIWGAIITGLSTVLPALGPAIGVDITGDLVREAGQGIVQTVQAVGGLVGTILTIYGARARVDAARAAARADETVTRTNDAHIHDGFSRRRLTLVSGPQIAKTCCA